MRGKRGFLLLLTFGAACRSGGGESPSESGLPSGRLEVEWPDSAGPVRFATRATARWCAADSLLEIMAVRRDTALGIVILAGDSVPGALSPGDYPLVPANVFIPWRPRSIAALRLAGLTVLRHFQSGTGQVTISGGAPDRLSGSLDLRLGDRNGIDSLHVTGRFTGLVIVPAGGPCGRADKPPPG